MRQALLLGSLLSVLTLGCGDDDDAADGGGGDEGTTWNCTCWSQRGDGPPAEETITRCSASDPTEMLDSRYAAAAEDAGLSGGCDPCEESDDDCMLED